mmetsp:Transcript_8704/g.8276  ORF Transcript_8704/g.8276 Transcript_8704/m.8276 type:complete len:262 (-) Transcript_8704:153-938(-)
MKGSLTATMLTIGSFWAARMTRRPIRPNPLIPMLTGLRDFSPPWQFTISANSGFKEAPPTRKPSISGFEDRLGAVAAVADPPYRIRVFSAASAPAISPIYLRISACVFCACSGVAVRPVPIAQMGSYATTTFSQSSLVKTSAYALIWGKTNSLVVPASRDSSGSPQHAITLRPLSSAYLAFLATSSLGSPFPRRSECPITTQPTPISASISAEVSPVNAPFPCTQQSCAPTLISPRSFSCTPCTYTGEGQTTTSVSVLKVD